MKTRFHIILVACLVLFTVGYASAIYKLMAGENAIGLALSDCGEEAPEKSAEENSKEADQEEDFLRLYETLTPSTSGLLGIKKNNNHSFGLIVYYPEIVSPPPRG